jgi:uncharacterized protein (DUF305 family)
LREPAFKIFVSLVAAAVGASCRTAAPRQTVAIVQPGAPGESTRVISPDAAIDLSHVTYTAADVRFMQGMIGHHAQAVEMVELAGGRTRREDVRILGRRIAASQADEIALMRRWLEVRGQEVPSEHAHHEPGATLMPGMLTSDEMARLRAATDAEFDRLFLEGMIKHHAGALTMVDQLFSTPGAGQEVEMFTFASDVDADQRIEIGRMNAMLESVLKELGR